MAGGSFSSMNKVIPGIYYKISKQAVQQPLLTASGVLLWIGERAHFPRRLQQRCLLSQDGFVQHKQADGIVRSIVSGVDCLRPA